MGSLEENSVAKAGLELEEEELARVNTTEGNTARFCLFPFVLLLCSGQWHSILTKTTPFPHCAELLPVF